MAKRPTGEPSWLWRRAMAYIIVGLCFLIIVGLGWLPEIADTRVNQAIVEGAFWLIGMVFLLYGGFATMQDVTAIWRTRTGRPYADPPVEPTPSEPDTVVVVENDKGERG
jgi:hypothetical protein